MSSGLKHVGWTETEGVRGCPGQCESCEGKMSRAVRSVLDHLWGPGFPHSWKREGHAHIRLEEGQWGYKVENGGK